VATVPSRVTVAADSAGQVFRVATKVVSSNATANISATYDGVTKVAALKVIPPVLSGLTLAPSTIIGGCKTSTGKVTLSGAAPAGGALVRLTNTNPAATVPSSVSVQAGATTASFTITATAQSAERTGTVTASYGGANQSAALKVRPIGVLSLELNPNPVVGPGNVIGKVTLECTAPAGGINVALTSSNAAVAAPAISSMTIPAGSSVKTFTIHTSDVSTTRGALIKAATSGASKSLVLTVN
jgi:hypothetical protein